MKFNPFRLACYMVMLSTGALLCGVDPLLFPYFNRFVLVKGGDLPDSSDSVDVYFDGMIILILSSDYS